MSRPDTTGPKHWVWVEYFLAFLVLAGLVRVMVMLYLNGYLPQPFFYEPSDTFMDWFNTAYWARNPGAYDSWQTIYPPLSFVFLRLVGFDECYAGAEGLTSRSCDWLGIVVLHGIYVLNIVLTAIAFAKIDRRTALPRAFALTAGMPMIFALERGNLILLCFTLVLLAYGPLVRSTRLRWLCAGLAGNFKLYLIAPIFAVLIGRRWLWFEGAILTTVIIYLVSYGLQGGGTPMEIARNIEAFSRNAQATGVLDIWYASTYNKMIALVALDSFPLFMLVDSPVTDWAAIILPLFKLSGQVAVAGAAVAAWLRPEAVPRHRLVFLAMAMVLITAEAGGYTMIMLILFVFMERWRGLGAPVAIVLSYILCIPGDIPVGGVPPFVADSYFAGRAVFMNLGIGLGPFVWPGIILLISISISCSIIRSVWVDLRDDGWQWRWRFRGDASLIPWAKRPAHPQAEAPQRSLGQGE